MRTAFLSGFFHQGRKVFIMPVRRRFLAADIMENHLSLEEFTQEYRDYIASYEAAGGDFEALLRRRRRMNDATVLSVSDDGEEELSIYYSGR